MCTRSALILVVCRMENFVRFRCINVLQTIAAVFNFFYILGCTTYVLADINNNMLLFFNQRMS